MPICTYGQLSPVTLVRDAIRLGGRGLEAFIEQVVVRRELAFNFVHFNKDYDTVLSLPSWARQTLLAHENDSREYVYTIRELEAA
ncbi:MAG: deoxyribodipyrimidine photolyase, partial [Candidatus Methanofastidiosa archaeon]|nr:deoxyribodipyrimidine photolyase [Candidatus Methanofastidiosa archaeon]